MTASEFLTYGGVLKVVRTDGDNLKNSNGIISIGDLMAGKDEYFIDLTLKNDRTYQGSVFGELTLGTNIPYQKNLQIDFFAVFM